MDALRMRRGPLRGAFTRCANALEEHLESESVNAEELAILTAQMDEKVRKLEAVQTEFLEILASTGCTEVEYEREFESAEVYRDRRARLSVRGTRELARIERTPPVDRNNFHTNSEGQNIRRKYRLPEIELKKFDGNPREWLGFWGQFKKIHEDAELDLEDKYQYLIQATVFGSKARELVDSFPPTAINYPKVIEHLTGRFGRAETLVEVYVRELLRLVLENAVNSRQRNTLSVLYDRLETQLRALETLGVTTDKYAAMLYPLVESCLPEDSLRAWERSRVTILGNGGTGADAAMSHHRLTALMNFLRNEVDGEERIKMSRTGFGWEPEIRKRPSEKRDPLGPTVNGPTAAALFNQTHSKGVGLPVCAFCDKGHASSNCRQVTRMTLAERKKALSRKGCCFVCFKTGHVARRCKTTFRCTHCGLNHLDFMCPEVCPSKISGSNSNLGTEDIALSTTACLQDVLLQTLVVVLRGVKGNFQVRALIDTGSQRSYLSNRAIAVLEYESLGEEKLAHLLFGGSRTETRDHKRYRVRVSSPMTPFLCNFEVLNQDTICGTVPQISRGPWFDELNDLGIFLSEDKSLKEPCVGPGNNIDLLIGADVAGKLFTGKIHTLKSGPVVMETRLGWTVMGSTHRPRSDSRDLIQSVATLLSQNILVADLWKLDSLGILDPAETKSREEIEQAARDHHEGTVCRTSSGRYEVALPWISGHPPLPNNRDLALKRLSSTVKKLKASGYLNEYQNVFKEWMEEDVIEEILPEDVFEGSCHYLPHRAVVKETSITTRVRPVFDASAKMKDKTSLNHCLEKGPNLIELIPAILCKFRENRIGVTSDIRRAFLQIGIRPNDRDHLRFFWWQDGDPEQLKVYRHRRVVFGVSASPFLLGATISHHLKGAPARFQDTAKKLSGSLYVDNCVTSVGNPEELKTFMSQAQDLMLEGKWDLRDWKHSLLAPEKGTVQSEPPVASGGEESSTSVLGLRWDVQEDSLRCDLRNLENAVYEPVTKRRILSVAHSLFDPIGFSCPVTLWPKIQLQRAWNLKANWDDELPAPVVKEFRLWTAQLPLLEQLKIPRWLLKDSVNQNRSLHLFCDASKTAYSACVFLRSGRPGDVTMQLVQARSRVAPLKAITIPRLELLACSIGARLLDSVRKNLSDSEIPAVCWTDSMNVLYWIKTQDHWGTFVWNRVQEIRSLTPAASWRHVPGLQNPADLPSRGCTSKALLESKWWEGPRWLKEPIESWPISTILPDEETVNAERKVQVISNSNITKVPDWIERYSSYQKIVRIAAWMFRFLDNVKSSPGRASGPLAVREYERAEARLLGCVQKEVFGDHSHKSLRLLETILDDNEVLRLKTRILLRDDALDFRYPIVLPSTHPLVDRLIRWTHHQLCHAGMQVMIARLRERYWILKCRRAVRKVIRNCGRCRRFDCQRREATPAALPLGRVKDAFVFETTGVDLAGPLLLKGGEKCWIVLFTCAVFRAVHLELVTSLATETFLQAFRRFVARRGRPHVLYSDNGTNFVGANAALRQLDWDKIHDYSSCQQITWKFNPPTAAWWGGWWERLIGMLKGILRRVLGRASLSGEELYTVLCDCERLMNSRPLTYQSDDPEELTPLTPAMFLGDLPFAEVPDLDALDHDSLNRRQRYRQKVQDNLRQRFRIEYLSMLKSRRPRKGEVSPLRCGEVVLIGHDDMKRLNWPLARVVEVYPGNDGMIRVCRVKTSKGELLRPVQRLYPLEIPGPARATLMSPKTKDSTDETPATTKSGLIDQHRTRSGREVKRPDRLVY